MWQLDRLQQRRARNALIEERRAALPISLEGLADTADLEHRRAEARGVFDFERQIVITSRAVRGTPAVYVVTPLVMADGRAVLVERGWVPSPDAMTVDLAVLGEPDSATVEGTLIAPIDAALPAENAWPLRVLGLNPGALAFRFPYPLLSVVLRRTVQPDSSLRALRAIPLTEVSDGPHLSYALQWFAFATIAVIGSGVLFVRLARDGRDQRTGAPGEEGVGSRE
jgi:surfeit locus 1 family protein